MPATSTARARPRPASPRCSCRWSGASHLQRSCCPPLPGIDHRSGVVFWLQWRANCSRTSDNVGSNSANGFKVVADASEARERSSGAVVTIAAAHKPRRLAAMFRRWSMSDAALAVGGFIGACHYRFVRFTNSVVRVPAATFHAPWENDPAILVVWHGEHFLVPFIGPRNDKINALTTLHRDGEVLTRGGTQFGIKFVRGSGDHGKEFMR